MSLFRKKKTEEAEEVPEERVPDLREGANWHEYAEKGLSCMGEGDVVSSVTYLVGAVGRFDGDPKEFTRLCRRISSALVSEVLAKGAGGKAVPVHIVSDVDMEARKRDPGLLSGGTVMEMLIEGLEDAFPKVETVNQMVMVATAGAYAGLGYMRYSPDVRDDLIMAGRCAEFANAAADALPGLKAGRGNISVRVARFYVRNFAEFFDVAKKDINTALSGYGEEELDLISADNLRNGTDAFDELRTAMDVGNTIPTSSRFGRRKWERERDRNILAYVAVKLPGKKE